MKVLFKLCIERANKPVRHSTIRLQEECVPRRRITMLWSDHPKSR